MHSLNRKIASTSYWPFPSRPQSKNVEAYRADLKRFCAFHRVP